MDKPPIWLSLIANCTLLFFIISSIIRHRGRSLAWEEMRADLRNVTRRLETAQNDLEMERSQNRKLNARVNELQNQIARINDITIEDDAENGE